MRKFYTETETTTCFYLDFSDFESYSEDKVKDWQEAYFILLSRKNTWGDIIYLDLLAHGKHADYEPFVKVVINPYKVKGNEQEYKEYFEGLGYKPKMEQVKICTFDVEDDEDIDLYIEEY